MEVKEEKEVNDVKDRSVPVGPVKNYKDLLVYRQAYKLALQTSKLTKALPRNSMSWASSCGDAPDPCPRMWLKVGQKEIRRRISSGTW